MFPKQAHAEDFVIEPVILWPKGTWISNPTDPNRIIIPFNYDNAILSAFEEVRKKYAEEFNGRTFDYIHTVRPNYSNIELNKDEKLNTHALYLHFNTFIDIQSLDRLPGRVIYAVFVVTKPYPNDAGSKNTSLGKFITFSGFDLENLTSNNQDTKDVTYKRIAHELGHSFGITDEFQIIDVGWERAHSCSENMLNECIQCKIDGTQALPNCSLKLPQPLYTSAQAEPWIMNYNREYRPFNFYHFPNNVFNQEKCVIWRSEYLKPFSNSSCPFSIEDNTIKGTIAGDINSLSTQTVAAGQSVTLNGKGFGSTKQPVQFYQIEGNSIDQGSRFSLSDYTVKKWSDNAITLQINRAEDNDTLWDINFAANNQEFSTDENEYLLIKANTPASYTAKVSYTITCGNNLRLPNAPLRTEKSTDGTTWEVLQRAKSENNGRGTMSIDLEGHQPGYTYKMFADSIDGIDPQPPEQTINIPNYPSEDVNTSVTFNYPQCPSGQGEAPPPTDKEISNITINGELWNYIGGFAIHLPGTEGQSNFFAVPVIVTYTDGSQQTINLGFNYQPGGSPPSCGKTCTYTQGSQCFSGNCLDGSQNCSININCGFVAGCSTGNVVSCSNPQPTDTPPPSTCSKKTRNYNQCGGDCNGRSYNDRNTVKVAETTQTNCDKTYSCSDQGPKEGQCGNPTCNEDIRYCDGRDTVHKHGGYLDNGGSCVYDFTNEGPKEGECGNPRCDEDLYYCDGGTTIHKHGGYLDNGGSCVYDFTNTGTPC